MLRIFFSIILSEQNQKRQKELWNISINVICEFLGHCIVYFSFNCAWQWRHVGAKMMTWGWYRLWQWRWCVEDCGQQWHRNLHSGTKERCFYTAKDSINRFQTLFYFRVSQNNKLIVPNPPYFIFGQMSKLNCGSFKKRSNNFDEQIIETEADWIHSKQWNKKYWGYWNSVSQPLIYWERRIRFCRDT